MKFYIASPFFNEEQLKAVVSIEEAINSIHADGYSFFSPRMIGVIKEMSDQQKKQSMKQIYDSNVENVVSCSGMICVIDWKDTGTLFELGYAAAIKKFLPIGRKIITFSSADNPVNVMLRFAIDAHARGTNQLLDIIKNIDDNEYLAKTLPEVNE